MESSEETKMNLCLLDPPRYGWSAAGGVVDLLPPIEKSRRVTKTLAAKLRRKSSGKGRKQSTKNATRPHLSKQDDSNRSVLETAKKPPPVALPVGNAVKPVTFVEPHKQNSLQAAAVNAAVATAGPDVKRPSLPLGPEAKETLGASIQSFHESLQSTRMDRFGLIACTPEELEGADSKTDEEESKKQQSPLPPFRVNAWDSMNKTVDMYSYHRGREGLEPRDTETGDLLCDDDLGATDTADRWEPKKLYSGCTTVTVSFPLGEIGETTIDPSTETGKDNGDKRKERRHHAASPPDPQKASQHNQAKACFFKDTMQWDLSDPTTPTPMAFATSIGDEYGLNFGQVLDLATSIQRQLDAFVRSSLPKYTPPLSVKDSMGNERVRNPKTEAPPPIQLYGAPVSAVEGGLRIPVRKAPSKQAPVGARQSAFRDQESLAQLVDQAEKVVEEEDKNTPVSTKTRSQPQYRAEVQRRAKASSIEEIAKKVHGGTLEIKENTHCHHCNTGTRRGRGVLFPCGTSAHAICDAHCQSLLGFSSREKPGDGKNLEFPYCPICCLQCDCVRCEKKLDSVACEFERRTIQQKTAPAETVFEDILLLCAGLRPVRGPTGASSSQRSQGGNKGRSKQKKRVPKIPQSDFPREVSGGRDLDPAEGDEYRTVFTAEGSHVKAKEEKNELSEEKKEKGDAKEAAEQQETTDSDPKPSTPDKPKPKAKNTQEVVEDGNVDYCQVCMKAGNLLCCDRCPRAFHNKCIDGEAQSEGEWECPLCEKEKDENPNDALTGEPLKVQGKSSMDTICAALVPYGSFGGLKEATQVLSMIHEMLNKMIDYDFGYMFGAPVDVKAIPQYKKIIKKPMDLGTVIKRLENGHYGKLFKDKQSWDDVLAAVLLDIELVWHNCFTFNLEGSAIYRMAEVHRRLYMKIRRLSFDEMLSQKVKDQVQAYVDARAGERKPKVAPKPSVVIDRPTSRYRISVPLSWGGVGRIVAALDPDTGMVAKLYTTMKSVCTAANFILDLGHPSEWTPLTDNSIKQTVRKGARDPTLKLFGYRWMFLDELKSGHVNFDMPEAHDVPAAVEEVTKPTPAAVAAPAPPAPLAPAPAPRPSAPSLVVEVKYGGSTYSYLSIEESLCFSALPRDVNLKELRKTLNVLARGQQTSIHDISWTVRDMAGMAAKPSPFPETVALVKQDTLTGKCLLGFDTVEGAYKDWRLSCLVSPVYPKDRPMDLAIFKNEYLGKQASIDGVIWRQEVHRKQVSPSPELKAVTATGVPDPLAALGSSRTDQDAAPDTKAPRNGGSVEKPETESPKDTVPDPMLVEAATKENQANGHVSTGTIATGASEKETKDMIVVGGNDASSGERKRPLDPGAAGVPEAKRQATLM